MKYIKIIAIVACMAHINIIVSSSNAVRAEEVPSFEFNDAYEEAYQDLQNAKNQRKAYKKAAATFLDVLKVQKKTAKQVQQDFEKAGIQNDDDTVGIEVLYNSRLQDLHRKAAKYEKTISLQETKMTKIVTRAKELKRSASSEEEQLAALKIKYNDLKLNKATNEQAFFNINQSIEVVEHYKKELICKYESD